MKRPIEWQIATVKAVGQETPKVKSFTLALPNWIPHRGRRLSGPEELFDRLGAGASRRN